MEIYHFKNPDLLFNKQIVLVDAKTPAALEIKAIIYVLKEQVASERTVFVKVQH